MAFDLTKTVIINGKTKVLRICDKCREEAYIQPSKAIKQKESLCLLCSRAKHRLILGKFYVSGRVQ